MTTEEVLKSIEDAYKTLDIYEELHTNPENLQFLLYSYMLLKKLKKRDSDSTNSIF